MKKNTTAEDATMQAEHKTNTQDNMPAPWYKQFWPWFVFGLPGVVVIAAIATVILAIYHADSTVSDQYYKEGLAINAMVLDLNRAKALDLSAEISVNAGVWQVTLAANKAMTDDHIIVHLQHPADSEKDVQFTLAKAGDQGYRGKAPDELGLNRWYIDIYPHGKEGTAANWRLKGEVDVSNKISILKNR